VIVDVAVQFTVHGLRLVRRQADRQHVNQWLDGDSLLTKNIK
jgi:hypothetical protein